MKTFIYIFLLSFCLSTPAVTIKVVGQKKHMLFYKIPTTKIPSNVGDISVKIFDIHKVPYEGGNYGFSRIFDLDQNIEIISDTEMKAYGWCFSLDGVVVDTMADQTPVTNQKSVIEWFYSYAHYKDGDWIKQCVRE